MPVESTPSKNLFFMQPGTPEELESVSQEVDYLFTYQAWTDEQMDQGQEVRDALAKAYVTIIKHVPPSPTRTRALNHIMDARLLANAAITFGGKY